MFVTEVIPDGGNGRGCMGVRIEDEFVTFGAGPPGDQALVSIPRRLALPHRHRNHRKGFHGKPHGNAQ